MTHPALTPIDVGPIRLRNRIIKTATFEGMTPGGEVSDALVEHHASMARNGVALTTVAYGAVHPSGRTFDDQLLVGRPAIAGLTRLTDAVHAAGGLACIQLAHCGGFSRNPAVAGGRPLGPSAGLNAYGLAHGVGRIRAMDEADLATVIASFAAAAHLAAEAGFDAVEVHAGHGYLLSQFLSPRLNRRTDRWGGSAEGRVRLTREVVSAVRQAVPHLAVLVKLNLDDGVPGGLDVAAAERVARVVVEAGADALVPSGGLVQRSAFYLLRGAVPLRRMAATEPHFLHRVALRVFGPILVRPWAYTSGFFRAPAKRLVDAVEVPVALLGGIDSGELMATALDDGFQLLALGRALLADPDLVRRLEAGEVFVSRCTHGNACVAEITGAGVRCVLP